MSQKKVDWDKPIRHGVTKRPARVVARYLGNYYSSFPTTYVNGPLQPMVVVLVTYVDRMEEGEFAIILPCFEPRGEYSFIENVPEDPQPQQPQQPQQTQLPTFGITPVWPDRPGQPPTGSTDAD